MKISDIVALVVIAIVVAAVIFFIVRQKKNGVKCIGCPHGKRCCSCSNCTIDKTAENTTK